MQILQGWVFLLLLQCVRACRDFCEELSFFAGVTEIFTKSGVKFWFMLQICSKSSFRQFSWVKILHLGDFLWVKLIFSAVFVGRINSLGGFCE
jgi:hypothetical protein